MTTGYDAESEIHSESQAAAATFVLADWSKRLAAGLVDIAAIALIQYSGIIFAGGGPLYRLSCLLAAMFALWNYWYQGVSGQTVGKRLVRIRLVTVAEAAVVGPKTSIVRSVVHAVVDFPFVVGALWPLWDERRQSFADKLLGTVVVECNDV